MSIRDELPAFAEWFTSVWVGEPPTIQDAAADAYEAEYNAARSIT